MQMTNPKLLPPQVIEALRRGDKIGAIKLMREASGLGLAEAKGAVEHHEGGIRPPAHPTRSHAVNAANAARTARGDGLSPGEQPRTAGGFAIIGLIVMAAIVFWLYS